MGETTTTTTAVEVVVNLLDQYFITWTVITVQNVVVPGTYYSRSYNMFLNDELLLAVVLHVYNRMAMGVFCVIRATLNTYKTPEHSGVRCN